MDGQSSGVNPPTNDVVGPSFISAQTAEILAPGRGYGVVGFGVWRAGRQKLQGTCTCNLPKAAGQLVSAACQRRFRVRANR